MSATATPESPTRASTRWRDAGWVLLGWTLVGLAFMPQLLIGRTTELDTALWRTFSIFGPWALLTPVVAMLVHRFPFRPGVRLRHGLALALAGVAIIAVHVLVAPLIGALWRPAMLDDGLIRLWRGGLMGLGGTDVVIYVGLVAILQMRDASQRLAARERALAEARLSALRGQLHPHFLFNVLNALSELVYRDAAAADRLLTRLAELLRVGLRSLDGHEHTLGEEIDFVSGYLDIEQVLLGDRLVVRMSVPTELHRALVPVLLLQPLVENAIRHGIAPTRRQGVLAIDVGTNGTMLSVQVHDTGLGRDAPAVGGAGVGLANLRDRLHTLYGDRHRLVVDYPDAGGCLVQIELPLRLQRANG